MTAGRVTGRRSSVPLAATGIVLAGGRSSRFGGDKLAAPLDGVPILERTVGAVAAACREVIVVLSPDAPVPSLPAQLHARVRVARDPEPFGGPLAATRAGLAGAWNPRAVVVGGDMPWLAPAVLELLLARLASVAGGTGADSDGTGAGVDGPGGASVAVASDRRGATPAAAALEHAGRLEQLPFALDVAAGVAAADRLLASGERRMTALLRELGAVPITEAEWRPLDRDAGSLRDVDRRADLDPGAGGSDAPPL